MNRTFALNRLYMRLEFLFLLCQIICIYIIFILLYDDDLTLQTQRKPYCSNASPQADASVSKTAWSQLPSPVPKPLPLPLPADAMNLCDPTARLLTGREEETGIGLGLSQTIIEPTHKATVGKDGIATVGMDRGTSGCISKTGVINHPKKSNSASGVIISMETSHQHSNHNNQAIQQPSDINMKKKRKRLSSNCALSNLTINNIINNSTVGNEIISTMNGMHSNMSSQDSRYVRSFYDKHSSVIYFYFYL